MEEEYVPVIEPTPEPQKFTCKVIAWLMVLALYGLPFVFAFIGWVEYDLFIGFCFLCFGYLTNGVIHSKLRQLSIPSDQLEISFSSIEIAKWFVSRYLVCR